MENKRMDKINILAGSESRRAKVLHLKIIESSFKLRNAPQATALPSPGAGTWALSGISSPQASVSFTARRCRSGNRLSASSPIWQPLSSTSQYHNMEKDRMLLNANCCFPSQVYFTPRRNAGGSLCSTAFQPNTFQYYFNILSLPTLKFVDLFI